MKTLAVCALVLAAAGSSVATADILRVDESAAPGGDGSTWGRAFDSLTDALAAASSGDQVWVAEGNYVPDSPAGRDATFNIPNGVQVYGGFEGDENSLAQRGDPLDPPTTLNGGGSSYHVVTMLNAGAGTILDGFFVIRGLADGATSRGVGGGVYADDSAPKLRNLVFTQNHASSRGGAVALEGTAAAFAEVSHCVFEDNTSTTGAGISANVPVVIDGCDLFNCDATGGGGGVRLDGEGVHTISDCEFRFNDSGAGFPGGGVLVTMQSGDSFTSITGCLFRQNSGSQAGGVAYRNFGDHEIRSCRFFSNTATGGAGAVFFATEQANDDLLIENTLMTGNSISPSTGAGAVFDDSPGTLRVVNTTIAENDCPAGPGGGIVVNRGSTIIDNSIIWGNDSPGLPNQDDSFWLSINGAITVNRSIIGSLGVGAPSPPGVGAIGSNPLFVDLDGADNTPGTPDDNARLQTFSPAIDRGNNLVVSPFVSLDIYGDPRFADNPAVADLGVGDGVNEIIDLGAAEYQPPANPGCNPADLAEPFGTLDFSDVLAFLTGFAAMDPAVDYAPPFGTWDFSDVLAFLTDFGDGCP